jgi:Saxitoxin biosynthesis operon protein SxtJ
MQWSDVTAPPPPKMLRQFAGLWLIVFVGLAAWRAWHGQTGAWTWGLGAAGLIVGLLGLVQPMAVRWIFTGWMIAAFPIGWTVSRVVLAAMFYLIFTPVGLVFRLMGRDPLHLRRDGGRSYWSAKPAPAEHDAYFRQS